VYKIILASIFDPRCLWSAPNCFMGLVIKVQNNTGATSGGVNLECSVIGTFSSLFIRPYMQQEIWEDYTLSSPNFTDVWNSNQVKSDKIDELCLWVSDSAETTAIGYNFAANYWEPITVRPFYATCPGSMGPTKLTPLPITKQWNSIVRERWVPKQQTCTSHIPFRRTYLRSRNV